MPTWSDAGWWCSRPELALSATVSSTSCAMDATGWWCARSRRGRAPGYGEPAEAVDTAQGRAASGSSQAPGWPRTTCWCGVRFDVVAVLVEPDRPATLQHYEAAF